MNTYDVLIGSVEKDLCTDGQISITAGVYRNEDKNTLKFVTVYVDPRTEDEKINDMLFDEYEADGGMSIDVVVSRPVGSLSKDANPYAVQMILDALGRR